MKAVRLTFAAFLPLVVAVCGGGDDTTALRTQVAALQTQVAQPTATMAAAPTPAPDRVVGVLAHCQLVGSPPIEMSGRECTVQAEGMARGTPNITPIFNYRLEVTVRSGLGTGYTVWLPGDTSIADGAAWPPK